MSKKTFLEGVRSSGNYNQWALILQTGLRTGEMIGLRWSDVDFENRVYIYAQQWNIGTRLGNGEQEKLKTKLYYYCDKIGMTMNL